MADHDSERELIGEVRASRELLETLVRTVGFDGPRPEDAAKAARWEVPLLWHLSDLKDSIHALRNSVTSLVGLLVGLKTTLEASASVSRRNSEDLRTLTDLAQSVERQADRIALTVGLSARDKPLLMRDLYYLDTEPVELGLIALAFGQAAQFLAASETLTASATFRALELIFASPAAWGTVLAAIGLLSTVAFFCRRRAWRKAAAVLNFLYFGVTGGLPMFVVPGAQGWLTQLLAATAAAWVFHRGPSHST